MLISKTQNRFLLFMLIVLVAVGQMAQTIYVPAMANMAETLNVRSGAIQQVMAAYLMTYGGSQLIYGPLSDSFGRRPVILIGMTIFAVGALIAMFAPSLDILVLGSAVQGLGTGVAGVMARTMPRDLYSGIALRQANSLLNMGILVSPLLAPVIGALLTHLFGWHACFAFLLLLCVGVTASMARWLPETRPVDTPATPFLRRYATLLSDGNFVRYLLLLIGALAGIAVFEASCGVLMGGVLGLDGLTVSILFILPIPAAFFGAWFAGREQKSWHTLMWYGVNSCLLAGLLMWVPAWFGVMNIWTLLVPAALFFFGAGMLFPLATSGAMEPYAWLAGSAGALIGGLQNLGSGVVAWLSALLPQHDQSSLGMLMFVTSLVMLLCWWPLSRHPESGKQAITG
ncbi:MULTISPECIES: multidrug efflux MFS transporter EmrD [Enterobacterales]|jgi:DHA1 family 2-module integral membrane pump EmrD-like MFS transporter|uniref:MFS transporter, DHA1 family, 2-module integral membrane pump EmrD n=1 Tax=Candidatus Pantoea symbiotica TaxID=1884370 RepID=A0A1I4DB95_9GAMM|nr:MULTISPECIES: multidrug efflux MFS transporter EmrD [Enterobacterales]MDY0928916.1 multidrug efflux MFS transporter EmrD [Enterobacter sp. CFBP8995]MRT26191.1 multidrug efflux MFS transporter EmrD [Enterobacteriaceae bacterium RIT697]KAJ9431325.1 multidrug efflux MFS transporter EmrD [Pantoea sp. YR343]MBB3308105.1 DHA1 family 2-module integral membrane pump EmrD-like MFS transporter [Enterobacter sp. Sphag1F]NYI16917.1 DHA1 family 2-module integral membrane pump EmrD-like MFS transporter [